MKIERFEDIRAWQEARALVKMVYDAVKADRAFNSDYRFREQMQSAAVSIMSNIAEGFSRRSTKEFAQFLFIAKGSVAEVQSQLYVALDQGYVGQEKFSELYLKADEVSKIISGFIQYLLGEGKSHLNEREKLNKLGKLNKPGGGEELVVAGNLGGG